MTMSLDTDYIVDRRRMRRKLTFWRVLAVLIAIIGVVVIAALTRGSAELSGPLARPLTPQISRVTIRGLIREDQERARALQSLAESSNTRAVIIHIDSPGGTTAGSEELYDSLRRVAQQKPTVVVVDGVAASGAYMAAIAADHIFTQNTSLVGSIGVLFQYPNVTDLLKNVGVKVESIKSSPLKAAPNGVEPTSPEAQAAIESLVLDTFAWFKGLVQDRRKLDGEALDRVTDGRVFTGRQAIEVKLVDELGRERDAIDWLAKTNHIDAKLPVRDWRLHSRIGDLSFLHLAVAKVLDSVGLASLVQAFESSGALHTFEELNLDGMLSLWHPSNGG
jgi:protease-4